MQNALTAKTQSAQREHDATESHGLFQSNGTVDPAGRPLNILDQHATNTAAIASAANAWVTAHRTGQPTDNEQLTAALAEDTKLREAYRAEVKASLPAAESNDKDYIFITFIMDHMPIGIIGLLLAMIFSAGMSSTSAELSALATTSVVDVVKKERTDGEQVRATKWATVLFGLLALAFAALFSLFENLIQAVNIIGSLFYGTILGIFLVAFFLKRVSGTAVFIAGLVSQVLVLLHFALDKLNVYAVAMPDGTMHDPLELAFLWYNLIAPAIVVVLAVILQRVIPATPKP
jgi:hypothetical protein